MKGLRIRDLTDLKFLAFDLKDILAAVGRPASDSEWTCSDVECTSEPEVDQTLEDEAEGKSRISGTRLTALASMTVQVIDGRFEAFRHGERSPWLIIEAIDSSFWEVFSDDEGVLDNLRRRFSDVEAISEGEPAAGADYFLWEFSVRFL